MNHPLSPSHGDDDLGIPPSLAEELRGLYPAPGAIPRSLDEAVLLDFSRARGRRMVVRRSLTGIGIAAAAALAFATLLWAPHTSRTAPPALAAFPEDINGDGRIDILDALALARLVESHPSAPLDHDVNGDGRLDRADVDAVAGAAVRLDRMVLQ